METASFCEVLLQQKLQYPAVADVESCLNQNLTIRGPLHDTTKSISSTVVNMMIKRVKCWCCVDCFRLYMHFVTESVTKGECKVKQGNRTGYQVTSYMVRYTKIHVRYNVLVYGKFQYPVIFSS